jgi:hypothetical protein
MRTRAAFVAFFVVVAASVAVAAPSQRIFRIDHAKVKIEDRRLVIFADGAVRTGGWLKPRLRMHEVAAPETNTIEVEFLATPPQTTHTVAQAILPVKATLKTGLPPYGTVQVRIVSETNSLIVPIGR